MKTSAFFAISAAFFGLVAAVPLNKRALVYQTVTSEVVETVVVTHTVWVDPATGTPAAAEFFESPETTTPSSLAVSSPAPSLSQAPASSSSAPTSSEAPPPAATSEAAPPPAATSEAAPPPAPTSEAAPVVIETSAPAPAPAPVETSAPAPAPQPSSEPAPAPAPAPSPEPAPEPAPAPPATGGQYHGEMTYYTPGMGSCGETHGESDWIVAVSHLLFDPQTPNGNPNNNPLCSKSIQINYGGQSFNAKIADRCPVCAEGDLDMPLAMFNAITGGQEAKGRVDGMSFSIM